MSTNDQGFGLRETGNDSSNQKRYSVHPSEWLHILRIILYVVEQKAAVSLYTSRDGNALAISVKHGKQHKAYWCGPDDAPLDVLTDIIREWGIGESTADFRALIDWLASEEGHTALSDE